MILNTVSEHLDLAKHVERRNHKIFSRGLIYITKNLSGMESHPSLILLLRRWKTKTKKKWRWKWLYHLSEAARIK